MSIGNPPEDDSPSLGSTLQQARRAAGLSVEQISTSTRVRIPIVQAIEADDFSRCGGDVYARGHLRTLARAVGLEAEPLVARYDAEHGGRPEPTPAAPLFEAERIKPERSRPNWSAALVAAIVAVVGFAGFTFVHGSGGGTDTAATGQEAAGTSPSPSPSASHRTTSPGPGPSGSAVAGLPKDQVTIKITARDGQSWVSAKDGNGKLIEDGLLKKGQSRTFTDHKRIDLVLGNAGAVQLYVNGKEVKEVGEQGSVERLSYTPGDPQAG
ncbi:helix-turn-helix domain-containing protein [Streptomyces sp. NPDC059740]|uniref:helix-turn-helix domain-containing protein n=1 Tax=Streptomyces sp. NPDC059740 TaxID=3346926 RepID=UPI00364BA2CB